MKTIKSIVSLIISFVVILSIFPIMGMDVSADTNYKLSISGTAVTEENKNDVLGNGKIQYDSTTKTLTFKDNVSVSYESELSMCTIYSEIENLTIKGSATITSAYATAILSKYNLTIAEESDIKLIGNSGITVNGGNLTVKGSLTCTGNKETAVIVKKGELIVDGPNAKLDVNGVSGISCDKRFLVNEGTVNIDITKAPALKCGYLSLGKDEGILSPTDCKFKNSRKYEIAFESDYKTSATKIKIGASESSDKEKPSFEMNDEGTFDNFVERLYVVALGRPSEASGKKFWVDQVTTGKNTGADCAIGFLNSPEFLEKGLRREEFIDVLYLTFFDRESDSAGKAFWLSEMMNDSEPIDIIKGFINSPEWCNICSSCNVKSGAPTAKATYPSPNATDFAERLYTKCLGRDAEASGLNYWALSLTNLENTGYAVAYMFFTSDEFVGNKYDNTEFVKRLYLTFMGREFDQSGLDYWVGLLNSGKSREDVIKGFASCNEFTEICNSYGINKGI